MGNASLKGNSNDPSELELRLPPEHFVLLMPVTQKVKKSITALAPVTMIIMGKWRLSDNRAKEQCI